MVRLVREGLSTRAVAKQLNVSQSVVRKWVKRAGQLPLDEVDWNDRPAGPRAHPNRTQQTVEDRILNIRKRLKECSDLGEFGAEAVYREMLRRKLKVVPSVRTIGRILDRRGALDGKRRVRRKAPPKGWYLDDLRDVKAELDSFDIVEGLALEGGVEVQVFTGISLHGGLCAAWPRASITAKNTVESLIEHWRAHGLPRFAKFDNDTVFQGPHHYADVFSRVMRVCLSLQVTPVFAPPRESGFQADIESFNGLWQEKVWQRFHFPDRAAVSRQSGRFVKAHRSRHASRIESAPRRRVFPKRWKLNLQRKLSGRVIYLRRTNNSGSVDVVGRTLTGSSLWTNRLVRVDVDLDEEQIEILALRRRDPSVRTLLATHAYKRPTKPFHE